VIGEDFKKLSELNNKQLNKNLYNNHNSYENVVIRSESLSKLAVHIREVCKEVYCKGKEKLPSKEQVAKVYGKSLEKLPLPVNIRKSYETSAKNFNEIYHEGKKKLPSFEELKLLTKESYPPTENRLQKIKLEFFTKLKNFSEDRINKTKSYGSQVSVIEKTKFTKDIDHATKLNNTNVKAVPIAEFPSESADNSVRNLQNREKHHESYHYEAGAASKLATKLNEQLDSISKSSYAKKAELKVEKVKSAKKVYEDAIGGKMKQLYSGLKADEKVKAMREINDRWNDHYKNLTGESLASTVERIYGGARTEANNLYVSARLWVEKNKGADLGEAATYRDLVARDSFNRDGVKTFPLLVLPLFSKTFLLLFVPTVVLPRKLLPRSFWSEKQRNVYLVQNHFEKMSELHDVVLMLGEAKSAGKFQAGKSGGFVEEAVGMLQRNEPVGNETLLRMKGEFRRNPLVVEEGSVPVVRAVCKMFEVNSFGTIDALRSRLHGRARDLMLMDGKMDVSGMSGKEVVEACSMRGVNGVAVSRRAGEYWLKNWVELSGKCLKVDSDFYLFAMMANMGFNQDAFDNRIFG